MRKTKQERGTKITKPLLLRANGHLRRVSPPRLGLVRPAAGPTPVRGRANGVGRLRQLPSSRERAVAPRSADEDGFLAGGDGGECGQSRWGKGGGGEGEGDEERAEATFSLTLFLYRLG